MRDADQGAKQVGCIEISAQIATLLGALDQPVDRALDGVACAFMKPGRAPGNGIQGGRDDVLCRNVIDQQQHPGSKRLERRHGLGETGRGRREFLHFVPVNTFNQLIARRKMAIEGTCANTRLVRDLLQAGSGALSGKDSLRNFKNALAVAQRV